MQKPGTGSGRQHRDEQENFPGNDNTPSCSVLPRPKQRSPPPPPSQGEEAWVLAPVLSLANYTTQHKIFWALVPSSEKEN